MKKLADIIFKGILNGIVVSSVTQLIGHPGVNLIFRMRLNDVIEGIPEEIAVSFSSSRHYYELLSLGIEKNDIVQVSGKIRKSHSSFWNIDSVIMIAEHVLNETKKIGY